MLIPNKPTTAELTRFYEEQSKLDVGYAGVDMTRRGKAHEEPGYRKHFASIVLGSGKITFDAAVQHMKAWDNFKLDWIVLFPDKPSIAPNTTLVVSANHRLLWSVNACRIIYTVDESTETKKRFGFCYGTLHGHVEQGEELFLIDWDANSNLVNYEILAYSKSNNLLVSLAWPLAIMIQDHFRDQSLMALKNSLASA